MSWTRPECLSNNVVTLTPVSAGEWDELRPCCDVETTRFYVTEMLLDDSDAEWSRFSSGIMSLPNCWPMTVRLSESGEVVGLSCFMDLRVAARGLEIGMTFIAQSHRGTAVNSSMKLLMLEFAFESLDTLRVQLKCDARNEHSRAAISAIGGVFEGVLRQHGVQRTGFVRDTAMFSILHSEWPSVRQRLQERITARSSK